MTTRWTMTLLLLTTALPATAAESPVATAARPRSADAVAADALFWQIFRAGRYEAIPQAMTALMAAWLRDPQDALTTAHVGYLHAWKLAEGVRAATRSPSITDEAVLARKFFDRATRLAPDDARFAGFRASFEMAEARIDGDEQRWQEALGHGRQAVAAWPDFNWFTLGYVLSTRPADSPLFREALEWQWQTLASCRGAAVDRRHPAAGHLAPAADERKRRACGNTERAPNNQEGFLLNMGDMLVKSGDWQTGVRIYRAAQQVDGYASWPYRALLERRIGNAERNAVRFNAAHTPGAAADDDAALMIESRIACVGCHQASP